MKFYKITGNFTCDVPSEENWKKSEAFDKFRKDKFYKTKDFNFDGDKNYFGFISDASNVGLKAGLIYNCALNVDEIINNFFNEVQIEADNVRVSETTLDNMMSMLRRSENNGFIEDTNDICDEFGFDNIYGWRGSSVDFGENVIEISNKKEIYKDASEILVQSSLIPELDRIYASHKGKNYGHPVHYLVETVDKDERKNTCVTLLKALYNNKRIKNQRYTFVDFSNNDRQSKSSFESLYRISEGGTMIVRFNVEQESESNYVYENNSIIEGVCEIMKKYRNSVLTIFCIPRGSNKIRDALFENLGNITMIEIKDEQVAGDKAREFLKILAGNKNLETDDDLFSAVKDNKTYYSNELQEMLEIWYNKKVKSTYYPQYKDIACIRKVVSEETAKGFAIDELNKMIGLESAKKVIMDAINYTKAMHLFAEKGMKKDSISMHMVFSGNPGTAKTTVARLFAEIMKENDILSSGHLVEVGRGDLVGKYVGWTADIVKKKFRAATGGVLFIDEAYSLVDDRDGSYGDEAINTIVQEMENHRDDVVVIFAGYPDKMEGFLNKNPGLRSRIAFHVHFDDYNADELCRIAEFIAGQKGMGFSEDAMKKLRIIFDNAKKDSDFGNGRCVRNIVEKAKLRQASRLVCGDVEKVTRDDINTILAEDIELPTVKKVNRMNPIGFCA